MLTLATRSIALYPVRNTLFYRLNQIGARSSLKRGATSSSSHFATPGESNYNACPVDLIAIRCSPLQHNTITSKCRSNIRVKHCTRVDLALPTNSPRLYLKNEDKW